MDHLLCHCVRSRLAHRGRLRIGDFRQQGTYFGVEVAHLSMSSCFLMFSCLFWGESGESSGGKSIF